MGDSQNGICGYELNNPDMEMFETSIIEVLGSCQNCDFIGTCLTPCESVRCLTPRYGQLVDLGRKPAENGTLTTYYALRHKEKTKFIKLSEPDHRWARASCIGIEQVPNWALSQLNGKPEAK